MAHYSLGAVQWPPSVGLALGHLSDVATGNVALQVISSRFVQPSNPLTGKSCGCYVRNCPCCPWSGLCSRCELAPLVLEGTGSKLRRIRESYWCARWPSYGSSQPPILQAIATAVETTPFIGTLRRNPISIRHSGGISIPRLEAFKADTSCGSVVQGSWHGPSIRDVYRFLAGKDVGAPTGTHPMHHSIAYPREGNRTNLHTSGIQAIGMRAAPTRRSPIAEPA